MHAPHQAAVASSEAESESSMRKTLQWIRKEKDLVDSKLIAATHQANIKEQLVQHLKRELDESRAELKQTVEATEASMRSEETHARLVTQLEENNLIRESNTMLRGEANRLAEQLKVATAKVADLEAKVAPWEARERALAQRNADFGVIAATLFSATLWID